MQLNPSKYITISLPSELTHTTKYGKWPQHSLSFPQDGELTTDTLQDWSFCSLSTSVFSWPHQRVFPGWTSGVGSPWTRGDWSSHFTTWTPSITVAWPPGSWIFLLASSSGAGIWTVTLFPSLPLRKLPFHHIFFFLWWLSRALWITYFWIFPNSTSKEFAQGLIDFWSIVKCYIHWRAWHVEEPYH